QPRSNSKPAAETLTANSVASFISWDANVAASGLFRLPRRRAVLGDQRGSGGRRVWNPVAASNACPAWRTAKSARCGPTIRTPTGSPDGVNPAGTPSAGQPVADTKYAERIQSR